MARQTISSRDEMMVRAGITTPLSGGPLRRALVSKGCAMDRVARFSISSTEVLGFLLDARGGLAFALASAAFYLRDLGVLELDTLGRKRRPGAFLGKLVLHV